MKCKVLKFISYLLLSFLINAQYSYASLGLTSSSKKKVNSIMNSKQVRTIRHSQAKANVYSDMLAEQYALGDPKRDFKRPVKRRKSEVGKDYKTEQMELITSESLNSYIEYNPYKHYSIILNQAEAALVNEARMAAEQRVTLSKFRNEERREPMPIQEVLEMPVNPEEEEEEVVQPLDVILKLNYLLYNVEDDWVVKLNDSIRLTPKHRSEREFSIVEIRHPYVLVKVNTTKDEKTHLFFQSIKKNAKSNDRVRIDKNNLYVKMYSGECFDIGKMTVTPCRLQTVRRVSFSKIDSKSKSTSKKGAKKK